MKICQRVVGAFVLLPLIFGVRSVAAQSDATSPGYLSAEWNEPCLLDSPAASAGLIQDGKLRPVGCDQPIGAEAIAYDDTSSCDNTESYEWTIPTKCCPGWNFYAGAVLLQRARPVPATVATPPTGTPGVLIDASRFGFAYDPGPEFILQRTTASGVTWEGRYFGRLDADSQFLIPNVTTFRVAGIGVTILGGGSINSFYSTDLDNTEINAWKQITPGFSILAGFRWVELNDTLRLNIATPNTFTRWDENNHLYGGQCGGKLSMFSPGSPLQFDAIGKAGVFGNFADNAFTSNIVGGNTTSGSRASFVGEVNLSLSYQLNSRLTARAGYMILWIDGVALAGEAAATTVQAPGGTRSPTPLNGGLWYNGATFGLDYSF